MTTYKFVVELCYGKVRSFYRIKGRNGEVMLTSQKYFKRSNARRAAKAAALNIAAQYKEVAK